MKMAKKQKAAWQGFLQGSLLALGLYMLGLLFLALLLVKGRLSEEAGFPIVAALCAAAVLCGGLLTIRQTGVRAGGLTTGAVFAVVLASVALCCWEETTWLGRGGVLLLCALAGGLAASLLGGRRRRTRRK